MTKELYPALHAPQDGYVFVVTYGRSGSTLTQTLLNAIPGYSIRGENGNLTYFLSRAIHIVAQHEMFAWRREDIAKPPEERRGYLRGILGKPYDPWAGVENVDPDDFRLSLMDIFVAKVLRPEPGCRVAGFKEIRFHEDPRFFLDHLTYLRDSFPKARFLFQTRDHEAVSKSSWWANKPKQAVLEQLRKAEGLFAEFQAANPEICFTISYERYAEGASYVRQIYEFLGENIPDAQIEATLGQKLKH